VPCSCVESSRQPQWSSSVEWEKNGRIKSEHEEGASIKDFLDFTRGKWGVLPRFGGTEEGRLENGPFFAPMTVKIVIWPNVRHHAGTRETLGRQTRP
jgi:hypothetical protein